MLKKFFRLTLFLGCIAGLVSMAIASGSGDYVKATYYEVAFFGFWILEKVQDLLDGQTGGE